MSAVIERAQLLSPLWRMYEQYDQSQHTAGRAEKEQLSALYKALKDATQLAPMRDDRYEHTDSLVPWLKQTKSVSIMDHFENAELHRFQNKDLLDRVDTHAREYFSQNLFRTIEVDWFYTDLLLRGAITYNEKWLSDEPLKNALPNLYWSIEKYDKRGIWPFVGSMAWMVLKWIALIVAVVILFVMSAEQPLLALLAVGLILLKSFSVYKVFKRFDAETKRTNKILKLMQSTYSLLENMDFDRSILKDDLKLWRSAELHFPSALWSACKPIQ
jgi:hypothetical protein